MSQLPRAVRAAGRARAGSAQAHPPREQRALSAGGGDGGWAVSIAVWSLGTTKVRPIALPAEHGGWGFLLEPLVLAMIVAPSWIGALICVASICGFLTRQPLKLAMQDLVRGKRYPRTKWCAIFASSYAAGAFVAVTAAIAFGGWCIAIL